MDPFRQVTGTLLPLDRANVDTDQIIPKQFLKRIERSGFGPFLFHDWRRQGDFILDDQRYRGAALLVTGPNFGCGSSREHAAWALQDAGFKAVLAPSFADIFQSNCLKIGLLPVTLPGGTIRELIDLALRLPGTEMTVDLEQQIALAPGVRVSFAVDPFWRRCLLEGWDEIALTLQHDQAIAAFEAARPDWLPRVR